jgi:hypothetical protein
MPNIKDIKKEFEERFVGVDELGLIKPCFLDDIWSFLETALATQQKRWEKKIGGMRIKHKKLRPYNAYEDVHNATLDDILALMRKVK